MRTMRMMVAFGVGMLLAVVAASAFATNNGNPRGGEDEGVGSTATASAVAGASGVAGAYAESGDSYSEGGNGYGGTGGTGGAGGAGGAGGSASSGGNTTGGNALKSDNKSEYLNLQMAMVNIEGCITANHVAGGANGGGGLIQWGSVNHTCIMNAMADAERHVETRSRLKCGAKEYREAMTFDYFVPKTNRDGTQKLDRNGDVKMRKPTKIEAQSQCVAMTIENTKGEINYLAELVKRPEVIVGIATEGDTDGGK